MITAHFDLKTQRWSLPLGSPSARLGKNGTEIKERVESPYCIQFSFLQKGQKIGPLIGILTSEKRNSSIGGNVELFRKIIENIDAGVVIVFSPRGLKNDGIIGYTYAKEQQKWITLKVPLPDVIYNRVPFRKHESNELTKNCIKKIKEQQIPFFNPSFFNKWDFYQITMKNKKLQKHIPRTTKFSYSTLSSMIEDRNEIMLKPIHGHKGNGIYHVSKKQNRYYLKSTKSVSSFNSLDHLVNYLNNVLTKDYIIQENIPLATFNERKYDYRVLAHFVCDAWIMTGIGVRLAKRNGLTTHVPKGGRILAPNEVGADFPLLEDLVEKVGTTIRSHYGNVREFSMDVGRTAKNDYYIFEVNAKPMKFDEKPIEEQRLKKLIQIFYEESGFKKFV